MQTTGYAVETANVWFAAGVPDRLVWRAQRWRVSDSPTELTELLTMLTHPPQIEGWRFQATNDAGETHVFDVVRGFDGVTWAVAKVYG